MFRRKGLEVLYLYEPVDEFALETLAKYKDYTFKAVEHADSAVLDAFADTDEQPKAAPLSNEDMNEFDTLLETIRKVLGDQIKDTRVSHRLADSPACLVSPDDGVTSSMERLMRVMQKDDSIPQKIFEINRDHPLLRTMLKLSKADPDDPQLAEMIQSLFDSNLLLDGFIKDPHAHARRADENRRTGIVAECERTLRLLACERAAAPPPRHGVRAERVPACHAQQQRRCARAADAEEPLRHGRELPAQDPRQPELLQQRRGHEKRQQRRHDHLCAEAQSRACALERRLRAQQQCAECRQRSGERNVIAPFVFHRHPSRERFSAFLCLSRPKLACGRINWLAARG